MGFLLLVLFTMSTAIPVAASGKPKLLKTVSDKPGIPINIWLPNTISEFAYGTNDSLTTRRPT